MNWFEAVVGLAGGLVGAALHRLLFGQVSSEEHRLIGKISDLEHRLNNLHMRLQALEEQNGSVRRAWP